MRLPSPRSAVFPHTGPRWDIVVASVFLVVTAASLVSAKTIAYSGAIFIAVLIATEAARGKLSLSLLRQSNTTAPIAALLVFAGTTVLWADYPLPALVKHLTITLIGLSGLAAVRSIAADTASASARLGESLWIGLCVGSIYIALRNVTAGYSDSAFVPNAFHTLIKFDREEATRSVAPVTLLLGPALLAISTGIVKPWKTAFAAAVVGVAVLAVASSPHETSKLALLIWFVIFGLAFVSDRLSHRLVIAGWIAACLLVVPASIIAHAQNLQNARWLQRTAQERILIWNEYSHLTMNAPVLGHGFDMSATKRPVIPGLAELPYTQKGKNVPEKVKPFRAVHPHNAYLQIWYELGAVGAGLFLAAGLSILLGLTKFQPRQRPYLYATAAATTMVLFSSYGIWQLWFIGLLAFAAIACAVAIRLSAEPDDAFMRPMS